MSAIIDNLRIDHRVTILREFTDGAGTTMHPGQGGILRGLSWDQIRDTAHLEIEHETGKVALELFLSGESGPRNGHMREFFEIGDFVPERMAHDPSARKMIVRPQIGSDESDEERNAASMEGPDRLEDMEQELRRHIDHIGVAASIAEMYAARMRAFQRAGNEPRAVAAFKLAVGWMGTYASWATSGGEGAALSYERDQFHAALAREFGYDPTKNNP